MNEYHDPHKEKPEDAQKRRAALCKEYGHSWIKGRQCSYCGATRKPDFVAQPATKEKKP